jgi:hypothetical protein
LSRTFQPQRVKLPEARRESRPEQTLGVDLRGRRTRPIASVGVPTRHEHEPSPPGECVGQCVRTIRLPVEGNREPHPSNLGTLPGDLRRLATQPPRRSPGSHYGLAPSLEQPSDTRSENTPNRCDRVPVELVRVKSQEPGCRPATRAAGLPPRRSAACGGCPPSTRPYVRGRSLLLPGRCTPAGAFDEGRCRRCGQACAPVPVARSTTETGARRTNLRGRPEVSREGCPRGCQRVLALPLAAMESRRHPQLEPPGARAGTSPEHVPEPRQPP